MTSLLDNSKLLVTNNTLSESKDSLITLSTLSRDVNIKDIDKLINKIVEDEECKYLLPCLIFYMRNHKKSSCVKDGGSTGLGEKLVSEKIFVSFYHFDKDSAINLVHLMVYYGYYGSLRSILEITTTLHLGNKFDYEPLWNKIYDIFVKQILFDLKEADKGNPITNASKYIPHENRNKGKNKDRNIIFKSHAKEIVFRLFRDEEFSSNYPKKMKTGQKKRAFRILRSKLNKHNNHIVERFLSTKRVENLNLENICSSAFLKLNKALFNLSKKGGERYDDKDRQELAIRLKDSIEKNPNNIPTPNNMTELANQLLSLDEDNDTEKYVLECIYKKTVNDLKSDFIKKVRNGLKLIKSILNEEDLGDDKKYLLLSLKTRLKNSICESILLIDSTLSQKNTLSTSILMAILLADVERELENSDKEINVVFFTDEYLFENIPISNNNSSERLKYLLKKAKSLSLNNFNSSNLIADFDNVLNAVKDTKRNIVLCSDFLDSDNFKDSIKKWTNSNPEKKISCWRFLDSVNRIRSRKLVYDKENPRLDLCIVMDTTGSMGTWIEHSKETVTRLLRDISSECKMTIRASFVSYKDFGDNNHLETHDWVSTSDNNSLDDLVNFISTLQPSGGGDVPEDMAGGLEKAVSFFNEEDNCLKTILVVADAPSHGFYDKNSDNHTERWGIDQRKRTLHLINHISKLGIEVMFAECGFSSFNVKMIKSFDDIIKKYGTFVDYFSVASTNAKMFSEKIKGSIESLVAQAIVSSDELNVDIFSGTDLGVPLLIASSKFSDDLLKLNQKENYEEPTTYDLLKLKLDSSTYDLVRTTMSSMNNDLFKDYKYKEKLSNKAVDSLINCGVTHEELKNNNYPQLVLDQFMTRVNVLMTER
jgi:hypothetical protein